MSRTVIIGASVAGVRTSQSLRVEGYDGEVVLVGAEPELPYDKPELSKGLLQGLISEEQNLLLSEKDAADADIELRVMGPGEVFGETAVFSDKPRTASVRATTDAVLLKVTSDVLSKAVGLNSWMGAFVRALADRFREADQRLYVRERAGL